MSVSLLFRSGVWFCCLVSSIKCQRTDQCYPAISTEGTAICICIYEKTPWVKLDSSAFRTSCGENCSSKEKLQKSFVQRKAELAPVLKTSAVIFSQMFCLRGEELVEYNFTNSKLYTLPEDFASTLCLSSHKDEKRPLNKVRLP